MTVYGYARVSTEDQNLEGQLTSLLAAGAELAKQASSPDGSPVRVKVFSEKESGAKTDRAALATVLDLLAPGDTLLVTRLDRLARSTLDLLVTLKQVADKGAAFRSLKDAWADTTTPHGRLMLTMLGGLAEFERSLILERTAEGRARAMAKGVRFGRKVKLTDREVQEAKALKGQLNQRAVSGEKLTQQAIAARFGVSQATISRL
jgi:DNA invertase Pin-like site-specific DNA recombinase